VLLAAIPSPPLKHTLLFSMSRRICSVSCSTLALRWRCTRQRQQQAPTQQAAGAYDQNSCLSTRLQGVTHHSWKHFTLCRRTHSAACRSLTAGIYKARYQMPPQGPLLLLTFLARPLAAGSSSSPVASATSSYLGTAAAAAQPSQDSKTTEQ
jgi:hypothetical protein